MRIAVCIKQVPSIEEVRFDPERLALIREGVPNQVNPFDRRALAKAATLRDHVGGEVVAVTMGPPQAVEALWIALVMGVDRVVHLCDPALAGADTLATARTLAAYLRSEPFDLILCGKYSVDSDTGQLGPEVAALLDIPSISGVAALEVEDHHAVVRRETDEGFDTLAVELPALLTVSEYLVQPTPPRVEEAQWSQMRDHPVEVRRAADLRLAPTEIGLAGSPTAVRALRSVEVERQPVVLNGTDPEASCTALVEALLERGALGPAAAPARDPLPPPIATRRPDRTVWVVPEVMNGALHASTFEMLGEAARIATQVRGAVAVLLIGADLARHVPALAAHGADVVYLAEDPALADYDAERYSFVLEYAIRTYEPWAILVPATANGRDFAPRATARLNLGLTGDAVALEVDADGQLVQLKPAFGGMILGAIVSNTIPQVATVRPGMLAPAAPDAARAARVERLALPPLPTPRSRLLQHQPSARAASILDTSDRVVCAGRGVGGPQNIHYVEALAETLGAAVGATRRVVDDGWLPQQYQIGLTGRAVAPQLYVAVGVSGNFNHTIGMRRAGTVVALNIDPAAPLVQQADFAVVGDYRDTVPALIRALERAGVAATTPVT